MNIGIENNSIDFNRLFPFFFVVDKSLQIIEVGNSLEKTYPSIKGRNFKEIFSFKRPWSIKYTFESILEYSNQLFILNGLEADTMFRWQVIPLENTCHILFIGNPWIVSVEEMHQKGLVLNDFALHDILPDIFQFLKASQINNNDMRILANELQSQKDLLQNVIDLLPHQIFLKDLNSRFLLVNKKVEELFGASAKEIVGKTYNEFNNKPDILGEYNLSDAFVIKTKQKVEITQEPQKSHTGKSITNHISKLPFEVNGELKGVLGIAVDISERLEYENKLKISEDKYRALIENALDIIYQINEDTQIVFINTLAITISEYSMEELLSKKFIDLMRDDYKESAIKFYKSKAFLDEPIQSYFEFPLITKSGKEIWISQKVQSIFEDNKIVGFQGFARDITLEKKLELERLNTENELKETALRLKSLIENLNKGILVEDEDGKILAVNDVFCKLFKINIKPNELIGLEVDSLNEVINLSVNNVDDYRNRLKEILDYKTIIIDEEIELNSGVVLERDYKPIFVQNLYKGHLWTYKDVTSKKMVEKELLKAKEDAEASSLAKEQFLSTMSHEIRTPMNAVIGITQLLINNEPKKEQLEYLTAIKYSADNLLGLINNILDFSKIESGNIGIENVDFDLHYLMQKVQNIFKFQADEKGIKLMVYLDHAVNKYLKGDTVRLNQIITNLVGNALKFTEFGNIEILIYNSLTRKNNIVFEVRDTGIGIEKDKLSKIFEKFTQANSDTTRKYGGTGLGLTITKLLVELLGGTISVESKVDVGTKFIVELPFEYGSEELVLKTNLKVMEMAGKLSGKKVLLVEDNKLNQLIAKEFMKQWGLEVVTAENGVEAISVLDSGQEFDLVLMDLQMPLMDGFTTTEYIRKNYQGKFLNMPIIALSAATSMEVKSKIVQVGMNDFISKPFESQSLFTKISEYILLNSDSNRGESNKKNKKNSFVFSLKYYEDFSGGNKDFVKEMINVYLEETPLILESLNDSVNSNLVTEIAPICHKLKTSFTMLGVDATDVKKLEDISQFEIPDFINISVLNSQIQILGKKSIAELNSFLVNY